MALPPPNATTWSTLHAAVEARLPHTAFYARLPLETAEDAAEAAAIRAGYKNEERLDCNKLVCYCGKRIGVGVVTDCSCLLHSGDRRALGASATDRVAFGATPRGSSVQCKKEAGHGFAFCAR